MIFGVLELELYKDGSGWWCVHSGFEPLAAAMADGTPAGTADGCVRCFE